MTTPNSIVWAQINIFKLVGKGSIKPYQFKCYLYTYSILIYLDMLYNLLFQQNTIMRITHEMSYNVRLS